jgi:hypothetical protein
VAADINSDSDIFLRYQELVSGAYFGMAYLILSQFFKNHTNDVTLENVALKVCAVLTRPTLRL